MVAGTTTKRMQDWPLNALVAVVAGGARELLFLQEVVEREKRPANQELIYNIAVEKELVVGENGRRGMTPCWQKNGFPFCSQWLRSVHHMQFFAGQKLKRSASLLSSLLPESQLSTF